MTGEFSDSSRPADWVIPDEIVASMDPTIADFLSGRSFNGIPIPLGLHIVTNNVELLQQVAAGDSSAADTLRIDITAYEDRYPGAPIWDNLRSHVADLLMAAGQKDAALAAIGDIKEPHKYISAIFAFSETATEPVDVVSDIILSPDSERRTSLLRAMRDRIIETGDIRSKSFRIISGLIISEGLEDDPVDGWIDSQGSMYPDIDWKSTAIILRDDSLWGRVPMPVRQHVIMANKFLADAIMDIDQPLADIVSDFAAIANKMREDYPGAAFWDQWISGTAVRIMAIGDVEAAKTLTDTIADESYKGSVALEYAGQGKIAEAIELVMSLSDYRLAAELLLSDRGEDYEEQTLDQLDEIITSDRYPIEQRASIIEYVRDILLSQNYLAEAAKYDARLNDLRATGK